MAPRRVRASCRTSPGSPGSSRRPAAPAACRARPRASGRTSSTTPSASPGPGSAPYVERRRRERSIGSTTRRSRSSTATSTTAPASTSCPTSCARRGFRWIHGMNYNPLGHSIPDLAERFGRYVEDLPAGVGGQPGPRRRPLARRRDRPLVRRGARRLQGHRHVRHDRHAAPRDATPPTSASAPAARDLRPGSGVMQAPRARACAVRG